MSLLIPLAVLLMSASVMSLKSINVGNNRKVIKLAVLDDSWIDNTENKHNDDDFLSIGHRASDKAKRALLQFEDITSTNCAGDRIIQANMYMYFEGEHRENAQTVATAPYIPYSFQLYRVKQDWEDTEVTGKKRKTNQDWNRPMLGVLNDKDAEVEPQGFPKTIYPLTPVGFQSFDVTNFIRSLVGGVSNHGLIVLATNEVKEGVDLRFTSKQSSNSAQHAYINVLCKDQPGS